MSKTIELKRLIDTNNITKAEKLISEMNSKELGLAMNLEGDNALQYAIVNQLVNLAKLIISKVDNDVINQYNHANETALLWAACEGMHEICRLLISRMNKEAIEAKSSFFGGTALHILGNSVNINGKSTLANICKLIINASPNIINLRADTGMTSLDCLFSKNTENDERIDQYKSVARLLIEHGAELSEGEKMTYWYSKWSNPMVEAVKQTDKIFNQQRLNAKFEITEDLFKMMANRFYFKLIEKYSAYFEYDMVNEYKLYLQTIIEQLPKSLYIKFINKIDQARLAIIAEDQISIYEAKLVSIIESNNLEKQMSIAPFHLLKRNYSKFKIADADYETPEQLTLDFYGENLRYRKIGTYLEENLNNLYELIKKLQANHNGYEILQTLQLLKKEVLLPKNLKLKLDLLFENIYISKTDEKISLNNNSEIYIYVSSSETNKDSALTLMGEDNLPPESTFL